MAKHRLQVTAQHPNGFDRDVVRGVLESWGGAVEGERDLATKLPSGAELVARFAGEVLYLELFAGSKKQVAEAVRAIQSVTETLRATLHSEPGQPELPSEAIVPMLCGELQELQEGDPNPVLLIALRLVGILVILFPFGVVLAAGSAHVGLFVLCTMGGVTLIFHPERIVGG